MNDHASRGYPRRTTRSSRVRWPPRGVPGSSAGPWRCEAWWLHHLSHLDASRHHTAEGLAKLSQADLCPAQGFCEGERRCARAAARQGAEQVLFGCIGLVLSLLGAPTYAQRASVTPPMPVIVTNPATNPIRTVEAYPRTPVHLIFCHGYDAGDCNFSYSVPTDKVLVVETMVANIECNNAT